MDFYKYNIFHIERSDYLIISLQHAPIEFVLHFVSTSWKEVIKVELIVSHNIDLLIQSSAFTEDWLVELMPNGMSFFTFRTFP